MKRISSDLKRMLSALAMQDASDYLSGKQKHQLLSGCAISDTGAKPAGKATDNRGSGSKLAVKRLRIAVPFTGRAHERVIDYLLNTSYFAEAHIDILAYGSAPDLVGQADILYRQLQQGGKQCSVHRLRGETTIQYQRYRKQHPELRFIVAAEDDVLAHEVINNPVHHDNQRHVPLVLIHTHNLTQEPQVSTA